MEPPRSVEDALWEVPLTLLEFDPMAPVASCRPLTPGRELLTPATQPVYLKGEELASALASMNTQLSRLKHLMAHPDWQPSISEPTETLRAALPDPGTFLAGGLGRHAPVLEEYLTQAGNTSGDAKEVLRWARRGFYWPMVAPTSPSQL